MTGSHEVRGSIPLDSTKTFQLLAYLQQFKNKKGEPLGFVFFWFVCLLCAKSVFMRRVETIRHIF